MEVKALTKVRHIINKIIQMKILMIIGTRPEAIKMAPLINLMRKDERFTLLVCSTTQHTNLFSDALNVFSIIPDIELRDVKNTGNPVKDIATIIEKINQLLVENVPDYILVQGDTTSAFAGALAGFYNGIRVAHVEAGLRTYDRKSPYPEEIHRQMISRIASLHFAHTQSAVQNLLNENIRSESIYLTGNTGVDALMYAIKTLKESGLKEALLKKLLPEKVLADASGKIKKLITVTGHRRENIGVGTDNLCTALIKISEREDVVIAMSVHPNPDVKNAVWKKLSGRSGIYLISPPDYLSFIALLSSSYLIISDSGGIQEEAPYLGKPLLITREIYENPSAIPLPWTVSLLK